MYVKNINVAGYIFDIHNHIIRNLLKVCGSGGKVEYVKFRTGLTPENLYENEHPELLSGDDIEDIKAAT